MAKEESRESILQREREIKKSIGVSPAFAAAAAYEGVPIVTRHILGDAPMGLAHMVQSGKDISKLDKGGTPLRQIAEFTRDEVKAIQRFASESGVKVPIVSGVSEAMREMKSGYFQPEKLPSQRAGESIAKLLKKKIPKQSISHIGLAGTSLPMAFHEIGHASSVAGSHRARRILQDVSSLTGPGGSIGNLARLAIAGNVLAPVDEDSSAARRFAYEHAPILAAATFAPVLAEELRASGKALGGMRRHGLGTFKAIKELVPMFGTYAGAAAAPVIATLLAKKLVQVLHAKSEEKTAAAKPVEVVTPRAGGALRTGATAGWHIGKTAPKPKSHSPNSDLTATASGRSTARAPSNTAYFKDTLESLYNPQRGFRIGSIS
jgi:hypothetical protein